ncbi:MAG: hypothetical protein HY901_33235 [Deltaproteobacteria bacterium]|nr:hypothetical protein [Deltaproteobacteria bacterium]
MSNRKGKALLAAVFACSLLGWAGTSQAGVIFESNFDSDPPNWNCSAPGNAGIWLQEWEPGWHSPCEGPNSFGGQTHYSYEVGPGGTTGNSMKVWTHDSFPPTWAYSWMIHHFSADYRELYTRWSMKIPPDMAATGNCYYQKLWRFGFGPAGPRGGTEVYFNAHNGAFPNDSDWNLFPSVILTENSEVFPNGVLADGQWHSYEFRLKLNSSGRSDGITEGWIDGVKVVSRSDRDFDATDSSTFTFTGLGFGNRSDQCAFQSAWRAIEFDDYVVSTTYIGPVGPQTPVNGACGSANGQSFTSAPTTNLCSSGTASALSGSGPWTWTCAGSNGGSTASCAASLSATVKRPSAPRNLRVR